MTLALSEPVSTLDNQAPFAVRFPQEDKNRDQDVEWCEIYVDNAWRRLRLHDYDEIYSIPGLYEHLFGEILQCTSPRRIVSLLAECLKEADLTPTQLRVLDVGAGNGMLGEQLRLHGVRSLVGLDIIPEAAMAAERDRPCLYDQYLVANLCDLTSSQRHRLTDAKFNCLCTASALGFGDIPPQAFGTAFNFIENKGWMGFNIKENFLEGRDDTGFCRLIRALSDQKFIRIEAYRRYHHRLSIEGKPLMYVAMTARKLRDMPMELADDVA
jgi:predicted TPR repeat methyltransferase